MAYKINDDDSRVTPGFFSSQSLKLKIKYIIILKNNTCYRLTSFRADSIYTDSQLWS